MAFPQEIKTFERAVDVGLDTDITAIKNYQNAILNGDFSTAQEILATIKDGYAMNLNASRFNELIDTIVAIEKFYLEPNGVRQYIKDNILANSDIALYDETINYNEGNIASYNGVWFYCKKSNIGIVPTINQNWEEYWGSFLEPLPALQYPIQKEQPTGQNIGDLWFEILE